MQDAAESGLDEPDPARRRRVSARRQGGRTGAGLWSLQNFFGAYTHPAVSPDNAQGLAHALGRVFDALDEKAPPEQLKAQAEELLAQRCYRNTLPTARKSIAHALTMRDSLIEKFPQYLDPAFREPVDLVLLAEGLSKGNDAWPKLEPILKSCLESADPAVSKRIVDLYSKADAAVAKQMEASLAAKWPEFGDANSTRAEKVEAIQRAWPPGAKISPEDSRLAAEEKKYATNRRRLRRKKPWRRRAPTRRRRSSNGLQQEEKSAPWNKEKALAAKEAAEKKYAARWRRRRPRNLARRKPSP